MTSPISKSVQRKTGSHLRKHLTFTIWVLSILLAAGGCAPQKAHVVWLEELYGLFGYGNDENTAAWVKEFNEAQDDVELELYMEHGALSVVDGWRDLRLEGHEFDHPFPDVAPYG